MGQTYENREQFLNRRIGILEWDIGRVSDEETLKRKKAELDMLRSELRLLKGSGS